jgi:hypothetical protein
MRSILFILLYSISTALSADVGREKALPAERTLALISELSADATLSDLKKIVGDLGMDVGSASHHYYYRLDDGSILHVRATISTKSITLISREHENDSSVIFPKRSTKTTEPNQALQTTTRTVTPAASHPSRQRVSCLI